MSVCKGIEVSGALAAILAGVLWTLSAWYGRADAPVIGSVYDYSTPEESARLADVKTAGKLNTGAALAAALAAFAQGAALFLRK